MQLEADVQRLAFFDGSAGDDGLNAFAVLIKRGAGFDVQFFAVDFDGGAANATWVAERKRHVELVAAGGGFACAQRMRQTHCTADFCRLRKLVCIGEAGFNLVVQHIGVDAMQATGALFHCGIGIVVHAIWQQLALEFTRGVFDLFTVGGADGFGTALHQSRANQGLWPGQAGDYGLNGVITVANAVAHHVLNHAQTQHQQGYDDQQRDNFE